MMNDMDVEKAIFAGGCFWCMEPPFQKLAGVVSVSPGYTDGHIESPSYEQVCSGTSGHTEAVEITFDPNRVTYAELLQVFWQNIDPTDGGGQFADRGSQYRSAIYYLSEQQQRQAETSRQQLEDSGRFEAPIVTAIKPAAPFYPAEEYHHDYHRKNPQRYQIYRHGSGREGFLRQTWEDES